MLPLSDFHLLCVPHEIKNDTFYNRVEATICQGHSLISSEGVQTKQTNKYVFTLGAALTCEISSLIPSRVYKENHNYTKLAGKLKFRILTCHEI